MIFKTPSPDQVDALEIARSLAKRLMQTEDEFSFEDLQTAYDDVVENLPDHEGFQIALGVAFGDIMKSKVDYKWVRVVDEYGEESALSPKDVNVACFPIRMIQKRLKARDRINVTVLIAETIRTVEKMRESGNYPKT